jgi:hypothetical protein
MFSFDDWNDKVTRPGLKEPEKRAVLQLIWYLDAAANGPVPFQYHPYRPPNRDAFYPIPPEGEKPLRAVMIDVEPEGTTAIWGDPIGQRVGPLRPEHYPAFEGCLRTAHEELRGVELAPLNRAAVGLLICGGQCTIRRLRVVPQPDFPR